MPVDIQAAVVSEGGSGTDLVSLRLLAAIADTGSISAASRTTGITQQAASARMRQLEARLGLNLLQRMTRGTSLTADGAVAAQWAAEVVDAADRFEAGASALRGGRSAQIAIAASMTIAEYLLPRWLMALRGADAAREVSVTATNSRRVLELVRDGSHELGFIESPDEVEGLVSATVARDEMVVVVAPQHPWARRSSVTAAELAAVPLVSREQGSGTRLSAEQPLTDRGLVPVPPLVELPTTAAIRTAVAAGAGPAVLSILAVQDDLVSGRLVRVPVADVRFIRELRIVYRTEVARTDRISRLLETIARAR